MTHAIGLSVEFCILALISFMAISLVGLDWEGVVSNGSVSFRDVVQTKYAVLWRGDCDSILRLMPGEAAGTC